jgi:DNA-binding SARP family transcriptional activator
VYDVLENVWSTKELKGDNIEPRYLSGLGVVNDRCLLRFGGYGSKTGNQELSPQHYYNAYIIDIETMEAKKTGTWKVPEENFVVSNSLIVDTTNNCFYALCYPFTKFNTSIVLCKFSLTEPEYETLADTIPLGFKDAGSYVDLFLDKNNHKLIAVTSSSISRDSIASVSIYSLSYPPFKKADLYQPVKSGNKIGGIILLSVLALLPLAFLFMFYKKGKTKTKTMEPANIQNDMTVEAGNDTENSFGIATVKSLRKQAISLFGGFQGIDKDGNDLTTEFKPLVRHLFLLVLLNTIKNGKGISFLKLKEILWFDMTEESALNNRGVAMSKIRQIMKHVGDVRFLKHGIYWTIEFGNDIYCDYYEALILIRKIKESKEINVDDIKKLLPIVSEGELLPNIQIEWIDAFKSDFSDELVDLFMNLIRRKEPVFSDVTCIDIANALFIHDPLNEDALKLKCSILVKMGKNGLAKNTYITFAKEYTAWFGVDYKYSLSQIVCR